jgi:hypothetical protein
VSCVEILGLLPFRSFDCLDADEAQAIEQHLQGCTACAAEARTRSEIMTVMKKPLPDADRKLPERIWENVSVAIAAGAPEAKVLSPELPIALVCSFCHDVLPRFQSCYCASCLAPHHEECFRAHGRCSAFGCEETRTVRPKLEVELPKEPPRRRRKLRAVRYLFPLVVAGGAVAALSGRVDLASLGHRSELASETPVLANAASESKKVTLAAKELSLEDAVAEISRQAGVPLIVSPDVPRTEKVAIPFADTPWREALDAVAKATRCTLQPLADGAILVEQPSRVTLQFTDANVRTVLQLLAAYVGANIFIGPEVRGDVTLDVHDAPWDKALETVIHTVGDYRAERRGEIVVIVPRAPGAHSRWGRETLSAPPWPRFDPGEAPGKKMDLDVKDASLALVCEKIAAAAGRPITVPAGDARKITLAAQGASWRDLLAVVVRSRGQDADHRLRIVERGSAVEVEALPKNTLQATDANVRTTLQLLANNAGKNLVVSPEVRGDVTYDIHDFPYDEALEATAFVVGDYATLAESGDLVRIVPRSYLKIMPEVHAERVRRVAFPGGRTIDVRVDATFVSPTGNEGGAFISGVWVELGGELATMGPLSAVRLVGVRVDGIVLEGVWDERPRVTVRVGN